MTVVVKSTDEESIALPAHVLADLHLQEGDRVKVVVEGQTLRFASLDQFLALRGALADDEGFDEAIDELGRMWDSWTPSA